MVAGISEVSICNNALLKINADTIEALTDTSKEGKVCNIMYPQLRDEVLTGHLWNFAIKQASLAKLTASPTWEYDNAYQLPADCLRVVRTKEFSESGYRFKIKGRELHTDAAAANIEYVAQITDTTQFNPQFVDVLATRLAAELAYSVAGSASRSEQLFGQYQAKLKEAKRRDGQEGIPDNIEANMWAQSRFTNWSFN